MASNIDKEERARRAANTVAALAELKRLGIPYTTKYANRLEVRFGGRRVVDFYPGTGRWRQRDTMRNGDGLESFLEFYYANKEPG